MARTIDLPCCECGKIRQVKPSHAERRKRCRECGQKASGLARRKHTTWLHYRNRKVAAKKITCKGCSKELLIRLDREHCGLCQSCNCRRFGKVSREAWNKGKKYFNKKEWQKNKSQEKRQARKREVVKMMGNQCSMCREKNLPMAVWEFHHRNPEEKVQSLSQMLLMARDVLMEEVKKCIMLCSNCHRVHHNGDSRLSDFETKDTE